MPTSVYAAMVEFDQGTFTGVPVAGYDDFDDAAGRADALFNQYATGAGDLRVFLAPEYYFSDVGTTANGATTIGSMRSKDKLSLYKKLKRTSAAYPDMLIVAGSIAYQKGKGDKQKHLSVCPVLAGGQILLKYYKRTYDQFQTGSSADSFDSKDYGQTFTFGGAQFGIEICLDHSPSYKTLKSGIGAGAVDIQLLVAAGSSLTRTAIAARTGGLGILCDMGGKGGGNGIVPVTGYANNVASVGAKINATVVTMPLASMGQVALYQGTLA